jgi:hypothetical protein
MEHFIDKYIPIRINQSIKESLQQILPESQQAKIESFFMRQLRELSLTLIKEEQSVDLKE